MPGAWQGEKAAAASRWLEAEAAFAAALQVEPAAATVNQAFWLGLCRAQVGARKGAEAVKTCTTVRPLALKP